jgi:hypothetical protein
MAPGFAVGRFGRGPCRQSRLLRRERRAPAAPEGRLSYKYAPFQARRRAGKPLEPALPLIFVTFLQHGAGKRRLGLKFGIFGFEARPDACMFAM